jgi:hypothetical protein
VKYHDEAAANIFFIEFIPIQTRLLFLRHVLNVHARGKNGITIPNDELAGSRTTTHNGLWCFVAFVLHLAAKPSRFCVSLRCFVLVCVCDGLGVVQGGWGRVGGGRWGMGTDESKRIEALMHRSNYCFI